MSSTTSRNGQLGNQIVRNLATSFIAKKHNLVINYSNNEKIKHLGIDLFCGENKYKDTQILTDNNYFEILNEEKINFNVNPNHNYFQTKKISDKIWKHLNSNEIMNNIIEKNKHKNRYKNNNDCFIHIRLGIVAKWNPGFEYYDSILSTLDVDNIYIATDTNNHEIVQKLLKKYQNSQLAGNDLVDIIHFGSTAKHVILSYGTFSAIIGYISYYSTVYYKKYKKENKWDWNSNSECNMFLDHETKIQKWVEII